MDWIHILIIDSVGGLSQDAIQKHIQSLAFQKVDKEILFRYLFFSPPRSLSLCLMVASTQHFPVHSQTRTDGIAGTSKVQQYSGYYILNLRQYLTLRTCLYPALITAQISGGSKNTYVSEPIEKTGGTIPIPGLQILLIINNQTPSYFCAIWGSLWFQPPPLLVISVQFLVHENTSLALADVTHMVGPHPTHQEVAGSFCRFDAVQKAIG